uniref:Alpha-conotoxin Vt1.27 n=1 Tax=Conus planorbis TaxID=97183 RepID=CA127_CONPO|nr:RecName: Full=Alpha-conotoxin Vt1.27; Flags: Precursor [Conus planorbis]ADJ67509.1 alpha-conotoxin Vt1.27 precursor [Conus planorbis]
MGMRMMFTVFLLVVLATTVVSFTLDRASDGASAAADLVARGIRGNCCMFHTCPIDYSRFNCP